MQEVVEYQARIRREPTLEINVAVGTERDYEKMILEPILNPACPVQWTDGTVVNVAVSMNTGLTRP